MPHLLRLKQINQEVDEHLYFIPLQTSQMSGVQLELNKRTEYRLFTFVGNAQCQYITFTCTFKSILTKGSIDHYGHL